MSDFEHLAELLMRSQALRSRTKSNEVLHSKRLLTSAGESQTPLDDHTLLPPLPGESGALCSICKGAGRVRRAVPFGHPDFGKDFACVCKEREWREKRKEKMIDLCEQFGLQRHQQLATFVGQVKGVEEAFEQTRDMIEGLKAWARRRETATQIPSIPSEWLVLLGPAGTGKTHLAMALANACIDAGIMTVFAPLPALLDDLRTTYDPESARTPQQWWTQMSQVEVLVLDDVGTQSHSDWVDEKVFLLVNSRYNAGLPTVITLTREAWTALDERIRSRVQHVGLLVSLEQAQDYRVRKSQPGE